MALVRSKNKQSIEQVLRIEEDLGHHNTIFIFNNQKASALQERSRQYEFKTADQLEFALFRLFKEFLVRGIDWRTWKTMIVRVMMFAAVDHYGSITKAADSLGIVRSYMSAKMVKFEKERIADE